jgi:hypothetical protein
VTNIISHFDGRSQLAHDRIIKKSNLSGAVIHLPHDILSVQAGFSVTIVAKSALACQWQWFLPT